MGYPPLLGNSIDNKGLNSIAYSRFGIDITSDDFKFVLEQAKQYNIHIRGLHFHISRARSLDAWKARINKMLEIADQYFDGNLEYIDIGSGMYGKLDDELQVQFGNTPSYEEYANAVALSMAKYYQSLSDDEKPILFTEPGTTIVSKYFHLFAKVIDIKRIRDKRFALLDCSFHNVGEICGLKRVPIRIKKMNTDTEYFESIDFVGYTCLEQDIILSNYSGSLAIGDVIEVLNVGGYSIVEKPPFIHPDIPVYMQIDGKRICVKREQTFEDIFAPYYFDIKAE